MEVFVQKVVEGYIFFLFFAGLLLFSLFRQGERSRIKFRAFLILFFFTTIIWVDYYLIYSKRLPMSMAYIVPAVLVVICILMRKILFPFKAHCQKCGKALSITEFLSIDVNYCNACYEKYHPETVKLSPEEKIRRENAEKLKKWVGWKPERQFVIGFVYDEGTKSVLVIDNLKMAKQSGKLSGVIGEVKNPALKEEVAVRTLKKWTGLDCPQPDYMGRLNFVMPNMNIRFHVYIARKFSGTLKEDTERQPVWMKLKKLKYNLMSMDYPLWLPRMCRGQKLEYYARCNEEGKIYEDVLDLEAKIE